MKILKRLGMLGLFCTISSGAAANQFDLALSKDTAAAEIIMDSSTVGSGGAAFSIGALFNDVDDVLGSLGLVVKGMPAGEQPYSFTLGGKLYFAHLDKPDEEVPALALGGGISYIIPANMPISIGGDLFYAPGITTFNDGDDLLDLKFRFEVDVLPSATAFIGYRNVVLGLDQRPDYDVDENVHVGIRIEF